MWERNIFYYLLVGSDQTHNRNTFKQAEKHQDEKWAAKIW